MKNTRNTSAFRRYCQKIATQYASGDAREHAYRPAMQEFLESLSRDLRVTNEPGSRNKRKSGTGLNKPDFVVANGQSPIGFIETKDIGEDLDAIGKTDQLKRYCTAYPNLILTDYIEFRRYVRGELRGKPIRIGKVNDAKQAIEFHSSAERLLKEFFEEFLQEEAEAISSASELASRLAKQTRQIKRLVVEALEVPEESKALHQLMKAFKEVLLHDLDEKAFADMFAQTLTYGLFAARVHHDGKSEFSRLTAGNILPPTNQFLRKLFNSFMNDHLPTPVSKIADEVIELLKRTNIQNILLGFAAQGKEDAVVYFYESFLAAYDPELRKKMGVYYTPAPVVDYMVRAVDHILQEKFGRKKGLADEKTLVLDPAVGTGSFLRKTIEHVKSKVSSAKWDGYVSSNLLERVFGFEILMAPYAVAHLKLGLQLQESGYSFGKNERLGVYLTNTLEETAKKSEAIFGDWISEEANAAARVKHDLPIMVVLGNPPYSYDSSNNGDWINSLLHGYDSISNSKVADYFQCDGKPLGERNPRGLNDDYVKFFRFAQWRITQSGHGVLVFITNHGFLDNPTFRGMRESLMRDFDELYFLDLHGNSNKKEKTPAGDPDENVFGIQQGVSVSFLVRHPTAKGVKKLAGVGKVYRADLFGSQREKYDWLIKHDFANTPFTEIQPTTPNYLFKVSDSANVQEYQTGIKLNELFPVNSVGIVTFRDALTIKFNEDEAWETVRRFNSLDAESARAEFELGDDSRDWTIATAKADIKSSGPSKSKLHTVLYRPFDKRHTYYTGTGRGYMATPRSDLMKHMLGGKNLGIIAPRTAKNPQHCFVTDTLTCHKTYDSYDTNYVFPLFLKNGSGRELDINFCESFRKYIKEMTGSLSEESAEAGFAYIYATLHSKIYVQRYFEQLKEDFPRVPLTPDKSLFAKLSKLGKELIGFHLMKDTRLEGGSCALAIKGTDIVEHVKYNTAQSRLYINKVQYFEGVTKDAFNFQVGGYQVLDKWMRDRIGRKLTHEDKGTYEGIAEAIARTIEMIKKIDSAITEAGGLPFTNQADRSSKAA